MELWVRSQSKDRFAKVTQFDIGECGDHYAICGSAGFLGGYDTKKRCIEILDEIQQMIDDAPILIKNTADLSKEDIERALSLPESVRTVFYNDDIVPIKTLVYQMPEK